MEMTSQHSIYN